MEKTRENFQPENMSHGLGSATFQIPGNYVYEHTLFYCASLSHTLEVMRFLQIEALQQPCVEQAHMPAFPTVLAHFISLCHILVTLEIFQAFSLLLYLL